MTRHIAAFGEDLAHQEVIGALIVRVADALGVEVKIEWRSARGGHGKVVNELKDYFRDIRSQGLPDLIVIGTDANCHGLNQRVRAIPINESPVKTVLAIPDPHIERWLLLDGAAFKAVFGQGCQAPDQKCARDRYKQALIQEILATGIEPSLGGIEFARDLVQRMDLTRAASADPSLQRFLDDLRDALKPLKTTP